MIVELRNEPPTDLRIALTCGLVGRLAEIDGALYRIDGWDLITRMYKARRARPDGHPIPDTAFEDIFFPDIERLVLV
jgi:hypothetical protein